eukprot:scaffold220880_cov18-Prasinocladus_malaysianus.AAC.3
MGSHQWINLWSQSGADGFKLAQLAWNWHNLRNVEMALYYTAWHVAERRLGNNWRLALAGTGLVASRV